MEIKVAGAADVSLSVTALHKQQLRLYSFKLIDIFLLLIYRTLSQLQTGKGNSGLAFELCAAVLSVCQVMFQKVAVVYVLAIFFQLLLREKALKKLRKERDELRAEMEDQATQWVNLSHTNKKLEADLAARSDRMHTLHLEVRLLSTSWQSLKQKVQWKESKKCPHMLVMNACLLCFRCGAGISSFCS